MKEHVGSNYFLRIDIKDFFESIKYEHFENFMYEMETFKDKNNEGIIKIIWNIISYNDYLVQGAVSSPMISNLIFRRTDQRILKYCQELGIKYTRYADDMTFSGDFHPGKIISKVKRQLNDLGLKLNDEKTRTRGRGQRQEVTGIVVNEKMQLPRPERKKIRQEMHYIIWHRISS